VLITQLGCPKGTRSTYLEVCDYFDIPTGDETRLEYTKEIKKKKKKKKKKRKIQFNFILLFLYFYYKSHILKTNSIFYKNLIKL